MRIRQSRLLGPDIELRLHLGEVALRFRFGSNIQTGVAQTLHHILRHYESVPADEAQKHLAGVAAEPATALGEKIEQADFIGGRPRRQELAEAAMLVRDPLHESGVLAHRGDLGTVANDTRVLQPVVPEVVGLKYQLSRSEEHTSELQSPMYLVCRLLLEK